MSPINFDAILAVWRRQLGSLLLNPLGYVFILAFVLVSAGLLLIPDAYFSRNIADLGVLSHYTPWLLIVLLPALASTSWALERELGTEEQLLTLPLTAADALIGKWLGVMSYFTVALVFNLFNVFVISQLGAPDKGLVFANFAGWWLAGAVFAGLSIFASTLVAMPAIAFVLGALLCAGTMVCAYHLEWFDPFMRGLVPFGSIVTAAAFVCLSLGAATITVLSRRWSTDAWRFVVGGILVLGFLANAVAFWWVYDSPLKAGISIVLAMLSWSAVVIMGELKWTAFFGVFMAVFLFNLSVQADRKAMDWDVTEEGLSTLHPTSEEVIKGLAEPVTLVAFISETLPPELAQKGQEVENSLKTLARMGGEKVALDLKRPADSLDEIGQTAMREYGFVPRTQLVETVAGEEEQEVFLGVAVRCGARTQRIDHFDPGLSVEYELIRTIRSVAQKKKKVLGIVDTDLRMMGGFEFQSRQQFPEWEIVREWKKQYDVRQVNLDADVDKEIGVLIVPQPSRLSDEHLTRLHDYIWAGRPALLLEDPMPIWSNGQAASSQPKQRPANPMMGMPPGEKENGDLGPLLEALGLKMDLAQIGWSDYNPSHAFRFLPPNFAWLYRSKNAILEAPSTTGIDSLLAPFPGYVRPSLTNSELAITTLVRFSPDLPWGSHPYDEHFQQDFFGKRKVDPKHFHPASGEAPAVAVSIKGKMKRAYPLSPPPEGGESGVGKLSEESIKVIFIADADLITDQMFAFYRNPGEDFSQDDRKFLAELKNVQFLANCVDVLTGDEALMALRTRRPKPRPLTQQDEVITATQAQVSKVRAEAEKEAEDAIKKIEKEHKERIEAIRNRKDMDEQTKLQLVTQTEANLSRQLEADSEKINLKAKQKIRIAQAEQRDEIKDSRKAVRVMAFALPTAVLVLLALTVFALRLYSERLAVPESRRRS